MKLDEADYTNIYLRIKEKLDDNIKKYFIIGFSIIGATSATALYSFYNTANNKIERAINEYVKSTNFKQTVIDQQIKNLVPLKQEKPRLKKT